MKNRLVRIYLDTSVFGGVFDKEFARPSKIFTEQVRQGAFHPVTSAIVQDEIAKGPSHVRNFFDQMLIRCETVPTTQEALRLHRSYLEMGIVSEKSANDALHVAIATVSNCGVIVSWNFKHIVNFKRIRLYNAVNSLKGYSNLLICSPQEMIDYEEEI